MGMGMGRVGREWGWAARAAWVWVWVWVWACMVGVALGDGEDKVGVVPARPAYSEAVKDKFDRLMWTMNGRDDDVVLLKERLAEFGERGSDEWMAAVRWGNWSSKEEFVANAMGHTTPLGIACSSGKPAMAFYLMAQGADPADPAEEEGFTAADKAAFSQVYSTLWAILEAGHVDALAQLSEPDGVAPIHRFVWETGAPSDATDFLRAAFAAGVDPQLRDASGKSLKAHALEKMGNTRGTMRMPRRHIADLLDEIIAGGGDEAGASGKVPRRDEM